MISDPTESFQRISPFCINLAKSPSVEIARDLENTLKLIKGDDITKMLEYVIFPLKLILITPSQSQELKQAVVECIQTLLTRGRIRSRETFEEIFTQLCVSLSCKGPETFSADLSEELIASVISCIKVLFDCSALTLKSCLYSPRFLPALGHCVTLLLSIAEQERSKALKLSSVKCLGTIAFCHTNATVQSEAVELENAVRTSSSEAFASFLPGISMSLCRVATNDSLQKHSVIVATLDNWGAILELVMNDEFYPHMAEMDDISIKIANLSATGVIRNSSPAKQDHDKLHVESNGIIDKVKSLVVYRDKAWFEKTATNLKVLIDKTATLVNHPNWKVRLAMVHFAKRIVLNCTKSMQNCILSFISLLVTLVTDGFEQVSSEAKSVLKLFSKCEFDDGVNSLKSMMQEDLHLLLSKLPRLIRTSGDEKKLQNFSLVRGYLNILGPNICSVLNSASHLKRLSLALVQVLEFDLSDIGIVEERSPVSAASTMLSSNSSDLDHLSHPTQVFYRQKYPKYRFKHFNDDKIYTAVVQICQLLGYYGNLSLLADHFLDLFRDSVMHRKQAVFILNEVIRGYSGVKLDTQFSIFTVENKDEVNTNIPNRENSSELESVAQLLLSVYLSAETWYLPTTNPSHSLASPTGNLTKQLTVFCDQTQHSKANQSMSFETLNSNVQLSCLLLESVGVLASALGVKFETFLLQSVYPVMARLANENVAVNQSAYATIVLISESCNYVSVESFICQNSDYLVNAIATNFKFIFMDEQAAKVLQVMIQYGNADILPIIEDTLMDIFAVIDTYPDQLIYSLMMVLNTLLHAITKWFFIDRGAVKKADFDIKLELKKDEDDKPDIDVKGEEKIGKASSEEICQFFLDYHKRKQMALGLGEIELDSHDNDEHAAEATADDIGEDMLQDKKPEIPLHLKYVKQILEKCVHFLSSKSAWVRLLVLDNVETGVIALKQSQNELLPMIHKLWPPLVRRFTDIEQVVTSKAVAVLCTMAEVSGDFMQRRVIKDVLPPLLSFLQKQSPISLKAGPIYTHTQAFKLQLATIESLGCLCAQLGIAQADLGRVAETCMCYLSAGQPLQLQQASIKAFEKFIKMEPDAMWLILNDLYCTAQPMPPHRVFKQVQLAGCGSDCKEFNQNVELLLKGLQDQRSIC